MIQSRSRHTAALAAILVVCGSLTTAATTVPAEDTDLFPVTIDGVFGSTVIEERPQRIVAASNGETDIALQLGVVPVAMGEWSYTDDGIPDWRRPLLADLDEVPPIIRWNPDGYDVEETLSYDPDVVFSQYLQENEWTALSAAVPTVALPYEVSMNELITAVGDALGLPEEAAALNAETDAMLAEARADYPQFEGKTLALGYAQPGELMNYTDPGTTFLLSSLGFVPAPELAVEDRYYATYGLEQLDAFDADLLIIQYASEEARDSFESEPLFQQLDAVREGRYLGLTSADGFDGLRPASPLQLAWTLEHNVSAVAELVQ